MNLGFCNRLLSVGIKRGGEPFYKIGSVTPFTIEIKNELKDFLGEIRIDIPNQNGTITVYAMDINMPKSSQKTFTINAPIVKYTNKIDISIVENEEILLKKSINLPIGLGSDSLIIGFLSDTYESLKYIKSIPVLNAPKTYTLNLDDMSLPDNIDVMKMLNVIIINDFDTTKLSNKQIESLKSWVLDGGLLVIGTGQRGIKTLSVFKDDFLVGEIGDVNAISTDALSRFTKKTDTKKIIDVLELDFKDSKVLLSESTSNLIFRINKGRGVIGVCAFDLGLSPFDNWIGSSVFGEKLLGELAPSKLVYSLDEKSDYSTHAYSFKDALKNVPELGSSNTDIIILISIIYIVSVGPINYFVLKRLDKRELMWFSVPLLSVIFAVFIYFTGLSYRVNEPIANIISVCNIDKSGAILPDIYAGIYNPQKSNIKINTHEDMVMSPMIFSDIQGSYGQKESLGIIDSKVTVSPEVSIEFYKSSIWSMRLLELKLKNPLYGRFNSDISVIDGKFDGFIENNTGFDLDELYIITPNLYIEVGSLKNKDKANINKEGKNYFGNKYDLTNMIYVDPYTNISRSSLKEEQIRQYRENEQKRRIMELYLFDGKNGDALLVGWSKSKISKEIYANNKPIKTFEKSFIISDISVEFKNKKEIDNLD